MRSKFSREVNCEERLVEVKVVVIVVVIMIDGLVEPRGLVGIP